MRYFSILSFLSIALIHKAQPGSCNMSPGSVDIYYPNTVTTPAYNYGTQYLCGPNTIVNDTLFYGCRFVLVDNNSSLKLTPYNCPGTNWVYLKNNCSLTILNGTGSVNIVYEPGAVINNPYGIPITTTQCPTITYQTINCSPVGINEIKELQTIFHTWPNPSLGKINIELLNSSDQIINFRIVNLLGETVYTPGIIPPQDKLFSIDNLANGLYFIYMVSNAGRQMEKVMVQN